MNWDSSSVMNTVGNPSSVTAGTAIDQFISRSPMHVRDTYVRILGCRCIMQLGVRCSVQLSPRRNYLITGNSLVIGE